LLSKLKHQETGVKIQDRNQYFKTYRQCFVGSECVTWLLKHTPENAKSREEAVKLCQELMNKGIIHHTLEQQPFIDGNHYYYFQKSVQSGYLGKLSKKGNIWKTRWFTVRDIREKKLWYFVSPRDPVPKNFIPLSECYLRVCPDSQVGYIELTTNSRVYCLRAVSPTILMRWVQPLSLHTMDLQRENEFIMAADLTISENECAIASLRQQDGDEEEGIESSFKELHVYPAVLGTSFVAHAYDEDVMMAGIQQQIMNSSNSSVEPDDGDSSSSSNGTNVEPNDISMTAIKRDGWGVEDNRVQYSVR